MESKYRGKKALKMTDTSAQVMMQPSLIFKASKEGRMVVGDFCILCNENHWILLHLTRVIIISIKHHIMQRESTIIAPTIMRTGMITPICCVFIGGIVVSSCWRVSVEMSTWYGC